MTEILVRIMDEVIAELFVKGRQIFDAYIQEELPKVEVLFELITKRRDKKKERKGGLTVPSKTCSTKILVSLSRRPPQTCLCQALPSQIHSKGILKKLN